MQRRSGLLVFPSLLAGALLAAAACSGDPACHEGECHQELPDARAGGVDAPPGAPDALGAPDGGGSWDVEMTFDLADDKSVEGRLTMTSGAQIDVEIASTGGATTWNIHSHGGGGTEVHESDVSASESFSFTAPAERTYYLLLGNSSGSPISVQARIRLHSGATFEGWLQ